MKSNEIYEKMKKGGFKDQDGLTHKYTEVASWAIWSQPKNSKDTNVCDMSIFDNPMFYEALNEKYVLLGMNPTELDANNTNAWHSFHKSGNGKEQKDYKLRNALEGTELWGSYLTDLIKCNFDVNGKEIYKYFNNKENAKELDFNIEILINELANFKNKPIIIALGENVYNLCCQQLKAAGYSVYYINHYSQMKLTAEEYKESILNLIKKINSAKSPKPILKRAHFSKR